MNEKRASILWLLLGFIGALLLAWGWPRAYPMVPLGWETTSAEARAIALERLRDLGDPVEDAYVTVRSRVDLQLERRLQIASEEVDPAILRRSELGRSYFLWDVLVYPPAAQVDGWVYRAFVGLDGEVFSLRRNPKPQPMKKGEGSDLGDRPDAAWIDEGLELDDAAANEIALAYLARQGFETSHLMPAPEIIDRQEGEREVLALQYTSREEVLGEDYPYGVEVWLAGREILGFGPWYEDPDPRKLQVFLQQLGIVNLSQWILSYLLLIIVAVPFFRHYHDGQLGARRGTQIFACILLTGLLWMALTMREVSIGVNMGFASRQQTTWLLGMIIFFSRLVVLGILGMMSWSLGEAFCRQRWPEKLASMDAFMRLKWKNATVARATLQGLMGGVLMAGVLIAFSSPMQKMGAWATAADILSGSRLPSLTFLAGLSSFYIAPAFFVCLLVPAWTYQRFGRWPGLLLSTLVAGAVLPFFVTTLPLHWGMLPWFAALVIPMALFFFSDLLSSMLALFTASLVLATMPMLLALDVHFQIHGWLALLVLSLPLWISLRHLGSGEEFHYLYDDIPLHVRRIAERERQRVELETARNIQSSILPELPPSVNGVEVAHTYQPASEVGGDFYDVMALEDGRLAVAVGDVAGHGVSSGLVMSMAKSALAVQVTFDPEVQSVFQTLNRMVYQSARRRLLTTLCYALLDSRRGEFYYASAGHLFPYRVSPVGRVDALEAASYPLGVRSDIEVRVRMAKLNPGDSIFMYSDGLVEATPDGSDEPFGFERLENSLRNLAGRSPQQICDGVLEDVDAYTGVHPRDDDLTLLVLRLPAA
jgi:hypothetical protein